MSQPSSLLLVDADTGALDTLTFGFEREGCKVSGTSDPAQAASLAGRSAHDLAVVALRSTEPAALEILGGIRSAAQDLPIVALGPLPMKPGALAAGAADFLSLPTFLRDVISVVRLSTLGARVRGKDSPPSKQTEDQTRLSAYYGLFYLLRAMAASERSGVLLVARGNRRAEIRVHEGAVVSANIGALQGLPALHHVLLWEEAALSLTQRPIAARNQLHLSAQEILDECERFLRDFAHSARDLGPPRTLYVPAADPGAPLPGFQQSQVTPLLRLFDGHRVLSDVIEESPFRIFDTVRMIRRLREAGALVARPDGLGQERTPAERIEAKGPKTSMLGEWAMVPDQRGVVGNRRSTSRRLRPVGRATPAAGTPAPRIPGAKTPAPTPIPLTARKGAASGEIGGLADRATPAHGADLSVAPTVQVRLDATGVPLEAPRAPADSAAVLAVQKTPPPVRNRPVSARLAALESSLPSRGRSPTGPQPAPLEDAPPPRRSRSPSGRQAPLEEAPPRLELTPRPRRPSSAGSGGTPDDFDAIEADFFAREADLYKREAIETFDDLDRLAGLPPGKRPRKR